MKKTHEYYWWKGQQIQDSVSMLAYPSVITQQRHEFSEDNFLSYKYNQNSSALVLESKDR